MIAVLHLNGCSVVNLVNFFSIYYFRCSNFIHNTIRVSGSFMCVLTLFTILLLGWVCMGREGFVIYLDQWELNNKLIVHVFCILSIKDNWPDFIVFLVKPDDSLIILDMNYKFIYDNRWSIYCLTLYAKVLWQRNTILYTVNWVCYQSFHV